MGLLRTSYGAYHFASRVLPLCPRARSVSQSSGPRGTMGGRGYVLSVLDKDERKDHGRRESTEVS